MKSLEEKIKNGAIQWKLKCLSVVFIIGLVTMGVGAIIGALLLNGQVNIIGNEWLVAVELAGEMDTYTSEYRMKQFGHAVSSEEQQFDEYEADLAMLQEEILRIEKEYEKTIRSEEDQKLYEQAVTAWNKYISLTGDEFYRLSREMKLEEVNAIMLGEAKSSFDEFQVAYDQLLQMNKEGAANAAHTAQIVFLIVLLLVIAILAASVFAGIKVSMMVIKAFVEPAHKIRDAANELLNGNLKATISYESDDEMGEMAESLRQALKILDSYVEEISMILAKMADGDLRQDFRQITDFRGDFITIKESFVWILKRFNYTLGQISATSGEVEGGSNELAHTSDDLAVGTGEQASAVEELTATVNVVTGMSEASARDTEKAYQTVLQAVEEARNEQKQMQELQREMEQIKNISNEISNIITTIEEIASQTNLLSLNASIEAARAGEAGKGFAVVANEIGNLANNCAQAAVNTRDLIEKTIKEIDDGNRTTRDAVEAFEEIIQGMQQIAELAKNSSQTTTEQAQALSQIEDGIEQIALVTQQNAASSEETSAISEQLAAKAVELDELVKRFQLFTP